LDHLEKTAAFDGHVQLILGVGEISLGEHFLHGRRAGAMPHLDSGGNLGVCGRRYPRGPERLVEQILEVRPAFLVSGGADIGQVVGNHIDVQGLGLHSGGR
jgi:hypothetical protein